MKIVLLCCIWALLCSACAPPVYQKMQSERDTVRERYEDARRKAYLKRSRNFLADNMLGTWEFLELVIEQKSESEDILKAKAARAARQIKGLRLRFWRRGDTYYYRLENLGGKFYGTYITRGFYKGDEPQSAVFHTYPVSGAHISDRIFSFARGMQKDVIAGDGEVFRQPIAARFMDVYVKDARLDFVLDLGMSLTPQGWLRRGNIRCSFQKIE